MKIILLLTIVTLLNISCSTSKDSILVGAGLGTAIGAGVGSAIGVASKKEAKGALVGGLVGAAIGGFAGWSEHQKAKQNSKPQFQLNSNGKSPALNMPEVTRLWVPDRIEDEKFIRGHWVYILKKNTSWRLENQKSKNGSSDGKK